VTVAAAALAAAAAAPFHSVTSLAGAQSTRERQGAITLALLALIIVAVVAVQWRPAHSRSATQIRLPRAAPWIALGLIVVGLGLAIVVGAKENAVSPAGTGANRLVTLQSNRYAYWSVALRAFGREPLRGIGAGGWAVDWLRYRHINDFAQDAHSLPLQTLAELGIVGAAFLLAFFAGIGLSAADAYRAAPALAAGPIAAFVAYAAHAPLDWDWQMPALTLIAIVLGGALLALGEAARATAGTESAGAEPDGYQAAGGPDAAPPRVPAGRNTLARDDRLRLRNHQA
jgi:O-antigen ligase